MTGDERHAAICEVLGIEPGRGSREAAAAQLKIRATHYTRALQAAGVAASIRKGLIAAGVWVCEGPGGKMLFFRSEPRSQDPGTAS